MLALQWYPRRGVQIARFVYVPDDPEQDEEGMYWEMVHFLNPVDRQIYMTDVHTSLRNRHARWKIGQSCQKNSQNYGEPCEDYICQTIAAGQRRQWRSRGRENPRQHAVPEQDPDVRNARDDDGGSGAGGRLPEAV